MRINFLLRRKTDDKIFYPTNIKLNSSVDCSNEIESLEARDKYGYHDGYEIVRFNFYNKKSKANFESNFEVIYDIVYDI